MNKKQILRSQPSSTSASQSTDEFDSAEERLNLDRPYIVSDDNTKLLLPN